jgi:hypothetical protein
MPHITYNNVMSSTQKAIANSATQLFDGSATGLTLPPQFAGIDITNNDSTNTIYLGHNSSVSATNYWRALSPGQSLAADDQRMGHGVASKLYTISSTGTPNLYVAVLA